MPAHGRVVKAPVGNPQLQFPAEWCRVQLQSIPAEEWRRMILCAWENADKEAKEEWRASFARYKPEMLKERLNVRNRTGRRFDRASYQAEAQKVYGDLHGAPPRLLACCFRHSVDFIVARGWDVRYRASAEHSVEHTDHSRAAAAAPPKAEADLCDAAEACSVLDPADSEGRAPSPSCGSLQIMLATSSPSSSTIHSWGGGGQPFSGLDDLSSTFDQQMDSADGDDVVVGVLREVCPSRASWSGSRSADMPCSICPSTCLRSVSASLSASDGVDTDWRVVAPGSAVQVDPVPGADSPDVASRADVAESLRRQLSEAQASLAVLQSAHLAALEESSRQRAGRRKAEDLLRRMSVDHELLQFQLYSLLDAAAREELRTLQQGKLCRQADLFASWPAGRR